MDYGTVVLFAITNYIFLLQEPFDDVDPSFSEEIINWEPIHEICVYSSPSTKLLLSQLFDFVILSLNKEAVKQDVQDPDEL